MIQANPMKAWLLLCLLCGPGWAQTHADVKTRSGRQLLVFDEIRLSRYSEAAKKDIPSFSAVMTNVSGEQLFDLHIVGILHIRGKSQLKFPVFPPRDIPKQFQSDVGCEFIRLRSEDVEFVEFRLESGDHEVVKDGYKFSGMASRDEGCLKDYVLALSLDGVELRKRIADLLSYQCGVVVESPMAIEPNLKLESLVVGGKKVEFARVPFYGHQLRRGQQPYVGQPGYEATLPAPTPETPAGLPPLQEGFQQIGADRVTRSAETAKPEMLLVPFRLLSPAKVYVVEPIDPPVPMIANGPV